MDAAIEKAARALHAARKGVALTGAGVSVESGIPDFRSPGGLWTKYPPEQYATIDAYRANPDKVWKLWHELAEQLESTQPNPGHHALAALEKLGFLDAVITQNVDNLHQRAGSHNVIEYHGNVTDLVCLECGRRAPLMRGLSKEHAPRCDCAPGALMKPAIVFFGEMIPAEAASQAELLAYRCKVMLIVGTSATVYPCAGLPFAAKQHGATVIECNLEPTEFTGRITDVFLQGASGKILPLLVEAVQRLA